MPNPPADQVVRASRVGRRVKDERGPGSLEPAAAGRAYAVTLKHGRRVDSPAHEPSVLAWVTAPTKAGDTTAARGGCGRAAYQGALRLADLRNAIEWKGPSRHRGR